VIIKFSTSGLSATCKKLESYCKPDKSYVLEIKHSKSRRSLNQNKYYWGVIITLFAENTGYTTNESHQELAGMFLRYDKEGKNFTRSTTELDTKEFEKYAEQCRFFMSENLGINVPLPNEISEDGWMQLQNIYNY